MGVTWQVMNPILAPMDSPLAPLDWVVIAGYLLGMIVLSAFLARGQRTGRDYYLGGNRMGALPVALSTMATQCSTNSLLGAPAFVAFAAGGGLLWLQYELAVPFAMILLMAFFYPVFRGLKLLSLYDFLERRFDVRVRLVVSVIFQFTRAFATGVTVLGVSKVLQVFLGLEYWQAVLIIGGVTVLYDILGGMRAVIWSDVIQIAVLWGAILAAIAVAADMLGGLGGVWQTVAAAQPERLRPLDFTATGLGDGQDYAFWPMLIGGLFLYLAYYGCDQTQAQRELATRDSHGTARALLFDGLLRFPLVASYCFLGVCLAAYALECPNFLSEIQLKDDGTPDINTAVPVFVLNHFPAGLVGLVMAGLLAAAMSSLDSTINALSALSSEDIFARLRQGRPRSDRAQLVLSKSLTLFWGAACLGFSFFADAIAPTIIEAVNKVSSFLNGPLLAIFALGLFTRRANALGAGLGLAVGLGANAALFLALPGVSWLWWNVFGALAGFTAGYGASLASGTPAPERLAARLAATPETTPLHRRWRNYYLILGGYGLAILALLAWV